MSGRQLAGRLGVSQQRVSALERAEVEGSVTIASLRQAADALGCDLAYVLVPRVPLERQALDRARDLARREAESLDATMALENQHVESSRVAEWVDQRAEELLDSPSLWDRL